MHAHATRLSLSGADLSQPHEKDPTEPVAAAHTAVQSVLNPDHSEFSTIRSDSRTVLGLYSHSSRVPAYQ